MEPLVRKDTPALTRGRLSWIKQNYFRAETLIQANAALVDCQMTIPLAQHWGGGEVASADGLRFVVPVRTLNAGPNPRYFGTGRGVTYYNFTSDQFTGFHAIVVPGTIRDSLYVLDGLLEHETSLEVQEIVTDTAAYSDLIFGLFRLQADGDAIADADARRLSPLVHKHLNFLGRYHFSLPGDVRGGELRELRDPNAGLEEEWLLPVGSP